MNEKNVKLSNFALWSGRVLYMIDVAGLFFIRWENGGTMRRKRSYRSYKFTDKHHSKRGVRSTIAGGIALVCTLLDLNFAYTEKGNAGEIVAVFGLIAVLCSIYGIFAAKRSFKEEEVYYVFSRIGLIVNLILVVFWGFVITWGFVL